MKKALKCNWIWTKRDCFCPTFDLDWIDRTTLDDRSTVDKHNESIVKHISAYCTSCIYSLFPTTLRCPFLSFQRIVKIFVYLPDTFDFRCCLRCDAVKNVFVWTLLNVVGAQFFLCFLVFVEVVNLNNIKDLNILF